MVVLVVLHQRPPVHQPVAPVEPRVERDDGDGEHQGHRPPREVQRGDQRPAFPLREQAAGEAEARCRQRPGALPDLLPLPLLAAAVRLDAPLRMAMGVELERGAEADVEGEGDRIHRGP